MAKKIISINDIEQLFGHRNLYRYDGKYYRLFGKGVTPNGCWIIAPEMRELADIKVWTGNDLYGDDKLEFNGVTGTISAPREFLRY